MEDPFDTLAMIEDFEAEVRDEPQMQADENESKSSVSISMQYAVTLVFYVLVLFSVYFLCSHKNALLRSMGLKPLWNFEISYARRNISEWVQRLVIEKM